MHLASIQQDLQFLTSPRAAGRLSGTEGARLASAYLAESLQALGIAPAGDHGFFQPVDVPALRVIGPTRLVVNGIAYRYRRDFGEMGHLTAGGSVRAELVVVRDEEEVQPEALRGKVVLIAKRPAGFDFNATAAAAADLGAAALMVEWGDPTWFFKTIFGSENSRIPVLRIREAVATDLASQPGALVELDLPIEIGWRPCRNVIGLLPGTNRTRTVALTAHYDHVGDDPGGERFPGAIDNASGVVAMLAVVRSLAERKIQLPFNILVGFLTGEESGAWGAKHLAANQPVPLSAGINLDGMGRQSSLRAMRLGYPGPGNWLADMAAEYFQQSGTEIQWKAGSDDSVSFQAVGLPFLGLGDMSTGTVQTPVHSPEDTSEAIHLPVIRDGAESVMELLKRLAMHPRMAS